MLFCTPGILYLLFFIIDWATKFEFSANRFFAFFAGVTALFPFGFVLESYFILCILCALLISIVYIVVCVIQKAPAVNYIFCLIPFGSVFAAIVFSLMIICAVGVYCAVFKGEFL